jgi:hypothetical protein
VKRVKPNYAVDKSDSVVSGDWKEMTVPLFGVPPGRLTIGIEESDNRSVACQRAEISTQDLAKHLRALSVFQVTDSKHRLVLLYEMLSRLRGKHFHL